MRFPGLRRRWVAILGAAVVLVVAARLLDRPSAIDYYRVLDDNTVVVGNALTFGAAL